MIKIIYLKSKIYFKIIIKKTKDKLEANKNKPEVKKNIKILKV